MNKYGKFTLGAVPIGDPKDASINLIDYIINHKIILVENVDIFMNLCKNLNIKTNAEVIPFGSNDFLNNLSKYIEILKNGTDILLLSDEGTAGIIDPGSFLLTRCKENQIPIKVMPGPNAIIPSVVLASYGPSFYFYGGSRDAKLRKQTFKILCEYHVPIVFFVEDDYLKNFIDDLIIFFGEDRPLSFCANLTKSDEYVVTATSGTIFNDIIKHKAFGQMTFVVQGKTPHLVI